MCRYHTLSCFGYIITYFYVHFDERFNSAVLYFISEFTLEIYVRHCLHRARVRIAKHNVNICAALVYSLRT
jgi:hypothetical protein